MYLEPLGSPAPAEVLTAPGLPCLEVAPKSLEDAANAFVHVYIYIYIYRYSE